MMPSAILATMTKHHLIVLLAILLHVAHCKSFAIQPKSWSYKGHSVGYDEARAIISEVVSEEETVTVKATEQDPILLLNGFGVGSFHQHRLMPKLLENESHRIIYCMDYLGQGRSWPVDCDDGNSINEAGLIYSADTWIDQLIRFIEEVILPEHSVNDNQSSKVHLVGNSVGGHLAVVLASRRPDLVKSLCLLNPTPFWGLNLPGWSGYLPPPALPRWIGRYLFDRIRDLKNIETMLGSVYANRGAYNEELFHQIRGCTEGKGGHAAFASILWAPPASSLNEFGGFHGSLAQVECDVLLIFGKNDPWCKPAFAKKMLQSLERRAPDKVHRYIELENVGHCPNHEAPQLVGRLASLWISAQNRTVEALSLLQGDDEIHNEPWGEIVARERRECDIQLGLVDRITTSFL